VSTRTSPLAWVLLGIGFLLAAAILTLLPGCANPTKPVPEATVVDGVEFGLLLTTPEGVKVYRFKDAGRMTYVAVSPDGHASICTH